jgi:membrane dipeptidase
MKIIHPTPIAKPICDLHCDSAGLWLAGSHLNDTRAQVNLPYMNEAGVGLQVFACYIPPSFPEGHRFSAIEKLVDAFESELARYPRQIVHCRTSEDVKVAQAKGQVAAILAVENGNAIEADLKNLEKLYQRGVRLMTIVHAKSNEWCISCNDQNPAFDGLTGFGIDVIKTMNDLGMIIDLSHSHDKTVKKVLKHSRHPVVASHSNAWALCRVPRNLKNELIVAMAQTGGLIGANFFPGFLDSTYSRALEKQAGDLFVELNKMETAAGTDLAKIAQLFPTFGERLRTAMQAQAIGVERYVDHIQYIADLVGAEHVAFGSDFDGVPDLPAGVEDCRGFSLVLLEMEQRGFSPDEMEAICWSNFNRILQAVCG